MPDRPYAPSWSGAPEFLGGEHQQIHAATAHLPGWQDPPDSQKLYEIAYHSGSVILEVGVYGGRSAVVELRGALAGAAARGSPDPQHFGVDIDPGFFDRAARTLAEAGLAERCLLYHGDLRRFLREVPIVPTMVFVDGDHSYEGVRADLETLRSVLAPGTPVLCHDYWGIEGVRRAVNELVAAGDFEAVGAFAGSVLLTARAASAHALGARGLSPETFAEVRAALWGRYESRTVPMLRRDRHNTPVRDLTRPARLELLGPSAGRIQSGRGSWPSAPQQSAALPTTMPGGKPWPRITVVTPSLNQGRFIEDTILSVLNQGYPNLEYMVIDGGSNDQTLAVLERYRDRLSYVVSEKDNGQSDAINRGFGRATGEILTWLNSDDMLAPGALAAAAMAFDESGADMVAGGCRAYRDGRLVRRHLTSCDDGPLPLENLLDVDGRWLEGQFFYQPEVLFTRAIWQRAGGRVDVTLYHSLDYELWVRMAEAGAKLKVIGRPIALFRMHPEQKTAGQVEGGYRAELPRVRESITRRLGRPPAAARAADVKSRPRVRIAMVNDLGYAYGAGIGHRRIAHALALAGHDVHALAATSTEPAREPSRTTGEEVMARLAEIKPDVVVVGNLHGAEMDPSILGRIAGEYETAFVMHDLWLLTGGCPYTGGCRTYLEGCGRSCTCSVQQRHFDAERAASEWEAKRRILASSPRLAIWTNSRWTMARAQEALGHSCSPAMSVRKVPAPPVHAIRLGIETDLFRPRDRMTCRDAMGLPRDRFIIMSSASSLADPRKGLRHLAAALELLGQDDVLVVCVGWFRDEESPIPGMRAMGYMREPDRLAMLYSAADLFVGPSLEEAFGQVFLEAAACGTPSVGYPVGGVPEAFRDGVRGRIAPGVGPAALAEAIDELYTDPALRESMGGWGRIWVENDWSLEAASRGLAGALRATGIAERVGLVRRLSFRCLPTTPPEPRVLGEGGWRAVSGFEPWGGPFPERGLPRCRWALGPVSVLDIDADTDGPARILISCRSHHPRQRVRLVKDGRVVGEHAAPKGDRVFAFRADLARGANRFEMHLWKWRPEGKPLGLIVKSIVAIRQMIQPRINADLRGLSSPGISTLSSDPRSSP